MPSRDIVLTDDVGSLALTLAESARQPKRIATTWAPPSGPPQDQVWHDGKNGYGYSEPGFGTDGYSYFSNASADYGAGADARQPGTIVPGGEITELDISALAGSPTIGVINGSFALGEDVYFLSGNTLLKVLSGYSTISAPTNAGVGATFTSAAVAKYSGTTYAWIGVSNGFAKWDGTTLTKTTSFVRAQIVTVYWATTDGVQVQRLFATDTNFTVTDVPLTSDPMTGANWTASSTVGDGVYTINKLLTAGHHVWCVTPGGTYDIDDLRQTYNLSPYHRDTESFYNGTAAYYVDNTILYSALTGIDALDVTNPLVKQSYANWILPGQNGLPNSTPIWGRATAFAYDDGWVLASLFNSTDSYIVYGKRRDRLGYEGPTQWVWHGALAVFRNQIVTNLQTKTVIQSGNPSKRLFVATQHRTTVTPIRLFWQSLPLTTNARQDALEGSPHRFSTTCQLYLTPGNWGAPGHNKTAIKATFDTRSLDSTHTLDLKIATNETTFGSSLGTVTTSPTEEIALTGLAAAPVPITGTQITPLVIMTGTNTVPPVLHSLTIQAAVDPQADEVWSFPVTFVRGSETNMGAIPAHTQPEEDYAVLCDMQGKIVKMAGPTGDTYHALIDVGTPGEWQKIAGDDRDGSRSWARTVTVTARLVNKPSRYGESRYDTAGARYGPD